MNPTALPSERLHYLDAVRAFALLLGIVFHAALSFLPTFMGWAVADISTSHVVSIFSLISHSFRMELFFLIAGFFARMSLYRHGARAFVSSRVIRIGVPFIIGWLLLRPLLVAGWIIGGQSMYGEVDILGGLLGGVKATGELATLFTGSHLWFLYYLMLATAITLLSRATLKAVPALRTAVSQSLDSIVAWTSKAGIGLFALALPTAGCLWFSQGWGMGTPDRSLVPDLPILAIYLGFFVFGWCLHRNSALIATFSRLSPVRFVDCLAAIAATLFLSKYQGDPGHPYSAELRLVFNICYAHMMWNLVAICIGLFRRFAFKPNAIIRYFADASYWLYLIHLPIVVFLQIAFAELELNWSIKLFAISFITISFSLLTYDLFIRSSFVGALLNGKKKQRTLFRKKATDNESVSALAKKKPQPLG